MHRSFTIAALLALLAPPAAGAQPASTTDARWAPWLGCWRAVDDVASTGARICVAPAHGGVTLTTVLGGQRVSEETRVADGQPHAVEADGCAGTETGRWSADARRLYRTATIACGGAAARTLTTAAFFVAGPLWIDVETVDDGTTTHVRVSRLTPAAGVTLADGTTIGAPARTAAADRLTRWTVESVIDLGTALPPDGVQAAIAEAPAPFALNARALQALAEAGVGERVIDLMVGVTYPAKFTVTRAAALPTGAGSLGLPIADPFFAPIVGPAALFDCYGGYRWAMSAYWDSCASMDWRYWAAYPGYYSGYWGPFGPEWISVTAGSGSGVVGAAPAEARVVKGRGYTLVQPVDTTYTGTGGGTFNGSSAGGGNGGNAGVSGSGYSGGGTSGGSERTAVPRGPGAR